MTDRCVILWKSQTKTNVFAHTSLCLHLAYIMSFHLSLSSSLGTHSLKYPPPAAPHQSFFSHMVPSLTYVKCKVLDHFREGNDRTCPEATLSRELEAVLLYQVYLPAAGLAVLLQVRFILMPSARLPMRLTSIKTFTGAYVQKSEEVLYINAWITMEIKNTQIFTLFLDYDPVWINTNLNLHQ